MKNFLFIIGLLISAMLFVPEEETKSWDMVASATQETIMEENEDSEHQRNFVVLSKGLKSSNCLIPRRISQTSGHSFHLRVWKNMEKLLQDMRLRGENKLHKVIHHTSTDQTAHISTLLCRMAEHVYALRKLII